MEKFLIILLFILIYISQIVLFIWSILPFLNRLNGQVFFRPLGMVIGLTLGYTGHAAFYC